MNLFPKFLPPFYSSQLFTTTMDNKSWLVLLIFVASYLGEAVAATAENCKENEPQQCAVRADTLLKDPDLVFPDTPTSVNRVCRTWSEFTSCIYDYTKRCLTRQQKVQFDRSFKDPVTSMRTLCEDTDFRREYLLYAPCIKKVSTEDRNCGHQYRFLIDHMSGTGSSPSSVKVICCARAKFKSCVLEKTREKCDSGNAGGGNLVSGNVELNATAFAVKALDKSLAFISQQCSFSTFYEEECPGYRENSKGPLEPGVQLDAAASDEKPQQTFQLKPTGRRTTEKPKQEKLSDNAGHSQHHFRGTNGLILSHLFHLTTFTTVLSLFLSKILI